MFCCQCGTEIDSRVKYCPECGVPTGNAPRRPPEMRLSRVMAGKKIAGVCGGFARYLNVDVTFIRVLWVVLSVFPMPVLGVVAYIVAWMVMPSDPLALPAPVAQGTRL